MWRVGFWTPTTANTFHDRLTTFWQKVLLTELHSFKERPPANETGQTFFPARISTEGRGNLTSTPDLWEVNGVWRFGPKKATFILFSSSVTIVFSASVVDGYDSPLAIWDLPVVIGDNDQLVCECVIPQQTSFRVDLTLHVSYLFRNESNMTKNLARLCLDFLLE